MAESTVQAGRRAASAAGWLDENDCCTECGEHFSGPCAPGCPRGEPADECDTLPVHLS
ncbi:hypothetical protein GA0070606_5411 [Micromonospora citrea]|uniref:Uncharacterized protein n=1 Tax=Micromonospora citrea TaxID=47855 RepID=A0A1C6VWK6_9ACTN|nr:hypothetical protein [Micromonospora citrea]SCL70474.1 hypothetical protein GA0070606_5411 [Micromonospora citrea]